MSDRDAIFAGVGVSPAPEEGDGYEAVKVVHGKKSPMFAGADEVTEGPLQVMMNNVPGFRGKFTEGLGSDEIRYLRFDRRLSIDPAKKTWNAASLLVDLKRVLMDAADTRHDRFYFTVQFGEGVEEGLLVHWVGVEVSRAKGDPPMILYDPGACGDVTRRPAWVGSKPIQYGLLLAILSDPDVRKAFDWAPVSDGTWGSFVTRRRALQAAEVAGLRSEELRRRYGSEAGTELAQLLPALGARPFGPKETACQPSREDYFCQSWVLYLFRERARGRAPGQIERDIDEMYRRGKVRRAIVDFVVDALRSSAGREYWENKRAIPREKGGSTTGVDFYAWLLHAASLDSFGREFLEGECPPRKGRALLL